MKTPYFLSICLNPVIQKTIVVQGLRENHVNRSKEYFTDSSGKGVNVSRVLMQCKENILHLTQAGGRNRKLFLEMLAKETIPVRWANSDSEIRFCYTLFDKDRHTSTEIVEEAVPVSPGTEKRVKKLFTRLLPGSHTVIISGTKAAGFSDHIFPEMAARAKKEGKVVILDYRDEDLKNSLPFSPDVIKPNYKEFIGTFFPEFTNRSDTDADEIMQTIQEKIISIWKEYGISTILTNENKPVMYTEKGKIMSIEPEIITPLNTTGCGDAFTAGFALEFKRTGDMTRGVKSGLECAGRNALTLRPGYLL